MYVWCIDIYSCCYTIYIGFNTTFIFYRLSKFFFHCANCLCTQHIVRIYRFFFRYVFVSIVPYDVREMFVCSAGQPSARRENNKTNTCDKTDEYKVFLNDSYIPTYTSEDCDAAHSVAKFFKFLFYGEKCEPRKCLYMENKSISFIAYLFNICIIYTRNIVCVYIHKNTHCVLCTSK